MTMIPVFRSLQSCLRRLHFKWCAWLLIIPGICSLSGAFGQDEAHSGLQHRALDVLSKHCLRCHSSDEAAGEFSLQTARELFDSGYVEPGSVENSHLMSVVQPEGDSPPSMPKTGSALTNEEVEWLRKWIAAGAPFPDTVRLTEPVVEDFNWWSLRPLKSPAVPPGTSSPPVHPIDAFIQKRLVEKGLTPSAPADRRTLIRRLSYDLTGLPPTPAEIEAFEQDKGADAWDRLTERLLNSPRYGERWGRHWLDVVKYADTCGYDKDKLRPNAWPYRDYVIRSFNEDKPYGRFVQEQIAGDVLFPGEPDGILGLGFIAAGPWDFIGHVEVPESKIDGMVARNLDRDDMVSNVMNSFCSVTIQCARCHNHKFDPFTQKHYYDLQSVFAAVDRSERPFDTDPETEEERRRLTSEQLRVKEALEELKREIETEGGDLLKLAEADVARLTPLAEPHDKKPEFGYHSQIAPRSDVVKWVEIDLGSDRAIREVVLNPCHDDFGGIGAGFGFPRQFQVVLQTSQQRNNASSGGIHPDSPPGQSIIFDTHGTDYLNPALEAVSITLPQPVIARYLRVTATKLAERRGDYILALSEVQTLDESGSNIASGCSVTALDSIEAGPRWRQSNLTDGIWPQPAAAGASRELNQARKNLAAVRASLDTPERIAKRMQLTTEQANLKERLAKLPVGRMVYAAATNFAPQGNFKSTGGIPRSIRVLHRGNETQPREIAAPGTIPLSGNDITLFELPESHSEADRRAALARWVTSDKHPLTWRSIVNRVWQHHFGRGIVDSPNDFGRMGQLPTHPELLDWLTVWFLQNGQSIKQLHRLIISSETYRQASLDRSECNSIDADNRLLWRMNRRKLSAEEVRDSILMVSSRLDLTMGGPGYYLFELEKPEHSPHYEYAHFDPDTPASHRRSIYRFVVRSQPNPFMTTLDCADSSQSTPRRNETITSLQALSLLNNRFNLVMARHFADALTEESGDVATQVGIAFQRVTGRRPSQQEQLLMVGYAEEHGVVNLTRMLFNLSEFLFVD
ncbi:MAG: DUF1553 domain-containing protein [Planctomycetaceae bacterium]